LEWCEEWVKIESYDLHGMIDFAIRLELGKEEHHIVNTEQRDQYQSRFGQLSAKEIHHILAHDYC